MISNKFQILARHFGNKEELEVVFKNNAVPSTNGKRIILPSNLATDYTEAMLGALLHETGHIKHTSFAVANKQAISDRLFGVVNCLEDIRIDEKIEKKYPNYRNFEHSLIDIKEDKIEEARESKKLSLQEKILFNICLAGSKYPKRLFDDKDEKYKPFADFPKKARELKSTKEIISLAKELYIKLFQDEIEKERKESKPASGGINETLKQIEKDSARLEKLDREIKDQQKEVDNKRKELNNSYQKNEPQGSVKRLSNELHNEEKKLNDIEREEYRLKDDISYNENHLWQEAEKEASKLGFSSDNSAKLIGFEGLNSSQIFSKSEKTPQDLLETIKNVLRKKYEVNPHDEGRFNPRRLVESFLDDEVRVEDEEKIKTTKFHILLDYSASMGSWNNIGKAFLAGDKILSAIEEVKGEGLPVESRCILFSSNYTVLFENLEQKAGRNLETITSVCSVGMSGTNIIPAFNHANKVETSDDNIIIVLTDGDFSPECVEKINIQRNPLVRYSMIRIGECRNNPEFFDYRITQDCTNIESILCEAILDAI